MAFLWWHWLPLALSSESINPSSCFADSSVLSSCLPDSFIFLSDIDPTIIQEIRYAGHHNFLGKKVTGYDIPSCILTRTAADALKRAQILAITMGYSLKVYDCYRPQQAVDEFISWSQNATDLLMKQEFYPTIEKSHLFPHFLATQSGHSRGSTVDLTLVPLPIPLQEPYLIGETLFNCFAPLENRFRDNSIDMGTGFDCFSPYANTHTNLVRSVIISSLRMALN
jgi:zinc D-Ala-D-Ala dipeptidase